MKKILIFVFLIIMCPAISVASIEKSKDDFNGQVSIASRFSTDRPVFPNLDHFNNVFFAQKISPDNSPVFSYTFVIDDIRYWFFSNEGIYLKIDGEIMKIENPSTRNDFVDRSTLLSGSILTVPPEIVDRIKTANEITVRANFKNLPDVTWKVPPEILAEWKQIAVSK